jgi:hypothetical protein
MDSRTASSVARLILAGSCTLLLAGCSSGVAPGGSGNPSGSDLHLTQNTSNAAPVFPPAPEGKTGASARPATGEWGSGNPLYSVYFTMREFLPERDEGVVDRSNLYKMLYDVDNVFAGASTAAQPIPEQEIVAPFSQLGSVVCDRVLNDEADKVSVGFKETEESIHAVMSWIWSDGPSKAEYGVAVASYDKATQDLTVDMTYSVDYDISNPLAEYCLRCWVAGNTQEHTFEFKYIIGNTQIVAKGVSQGEGQSMLFKYANPSDPVRYIVVPADADETFFIAQNADPTQVFTDPLALPASVSDYREWVENTAFFEAENLVTDVSTLNAGNAMAGTIYLNFQP